MFRFLRSARAYGRTIQSLRIFMILLKQIFISDLHEIFQNGAEFYRASLPQDLPNALLQCKMNFDADCCEFAVTSAMLCEAKHATTAYNREDEN